MNKKETLKLIDDYFDSASDLAIKLIKSEAEILLRKHSNLKEFVMSMGSSFFIDKNDKIIDNWEFKYIESFNDMINELDEKFHCTGYPMRLKICLDDGSLMEQNDW